MPTTTGAKTAYPDPTGGHADITMPTVNYAQRIRTELAGRLPDCDDALLDLYTLLGLQYGAFVRLVDVHNAWAVWRNRTNPEHRSLIPFTSLPPEVQELDRPYVDAIRAAAQAVHDAVTTGKEF